MTTQRLYVYLYVDANRKPRWYPVRYTRYTKQ